MGWIHLRAGDDHVLDAYCATPAAPRGAIVVLQEIFGVNPHIRSLCERYAKDGWLAVAPALYDRAVKGTVLGYDASGIASGRDLCGQVGNENALRDVQAAVDFAASALGPQGKVGVIGFCWGGTLAWLSAARLSGISGVVAYYGTGIAAHVHETPQVPVLLHFGEQDAHIPMEHLDAIARAWPAVPLHRYPTGHGFHCDDRPAYHPPSAELANARTRDFLEKKITC